MGVIRKPIRRVRTQGMRKEFGNDRNQAMCSICSGAGTKRSEEGTGKVVFVLTIFIGGWWTGTYLTPLSKPVAGEILKDREIGTNPLADRMASLVMLFAGGN